MGAAATAVRASNDSSFAAGSAGLGGAGGAGGIRGEDFKSMTLVNVYSAFSMIGSTCYKIPKRLSKSYIAGIIFVRLCILENTFTKG